MDTTVEHDQKALVFLIGASDLRRIFQEWPDLMQLAVCLRADGECKMIVYREEEGSRFLPRLRRALKLPPEDICFYPEVDGYPSRRLLYSEEKQLFTLVRNAPEVVEEARDYSLNFTYAMDEGIDPLAFLNTDAAVREGKKNSVKETPKKTETRRGNRLNLHLAHTPDATEVPEGTALPRFMQKAGNQEPGTSFRSITQIQKQNLAPNTVFIHPEKDGWIAIDLPGCLGGQVTISNPGRIFVRDDRKQMALHNDFIGQDDNVLPERINLGVKFLPDGVKQILETNAGEAGVTFKNGFLFITTKRSAVTTAKSAPVKRPREGALPWRLWASAAAILAVAAIGLQSTLSLNKAGDSDGAIDWTQFRSGALEVERDQTVGPIAQVFRRSNS